MAMGEKKLVERKLFAGARVRRLRRELALTQAAMAEALGIGLHGTYRWGDHPPKLRQFEIERLSDGELVAS